MEDGMLAGGTWGGIVSAVVDYEPVDPDGPADWDDDTDGFDIHWVLHTDNELTVR